MKLRHIAALALVLWLLVLDKQPWITIQTFATRQECAQISYSLNPECAPERMFKNSLACHPEEVCVPSDDPRLTGITPSPSASS